MWTLIPSRERKLYLLIESLYYSDKPMSLQELAKSVDSSKRSICNYIDEIKTRVENSSGSLITLMDGYQLKLPDNINIDVFQHQVLQSSLSFQLLEKLLYNDEITGTELEQELHISRSSLSRILTQLKDSLSPFGLSIESHPYRIIGDEFLVRRFYTTYFLEAYGYNSWPFATVEKSEIYKLVESLAKIESIRFKTVNVQKFIVFTAVSVIREHFHHDICQSALSEGRYEGDSFKRMRSNVNHWLNSADIPSDKKELYRRIYTFYMFIYFRSYTQKHFSLGSVDYSTFIISCLKEVARQFNLPVIDFRHIANKLDDMLYQYSRTDFSKALDSHIIFKPRDYNMVKMYASEYPSFYQKLLDMLEEVYVLSGIDSEKINTDELLYLIISRWNQLSLHLYKNYTTCHLLVYSPISYQHANNIAELLRAKLEKACRISIYTEPNLTTETLKKYTFDILISSSSLNLNIKQPIIALHNKYSGHHLQPLLSAIDKVFKDNRQILSDQNGL